MTSHSLDLPPGVSFRSLSRLDVWRLSNHAVLPRECIGFVATRDGKDIAAAMAAMGYGCWWIAAWFIDGDLARRNKACVYRIALMWLASLKVADLGPLLAIPDRGISEAWFRHLGFVRNGELLDGREVYQWAS